MSKNMHAWEETRKMGRTSFILRYGTLLFGGLCLLAWPYAGRLTAYAISKATDLDIVLPPTFGSFQWYLTRLPFFLGIGTVWGTVIWGLSEAKFKRFIQAERVSLIDKEIEEKSAD